jgi:hypothetical protein
MPSEARSCRARSGGQRWASPREDRVGLEHLARGQVVEHALEGNRREAAPGQERHDVAEQRAGVARNAAAYCPTLAPTSTTRSTS